MKEDDSGPQPAPRYARFWLLVRGAGPLVLVALALLAGPTLVVWWLRGGPFGVDDVLIGGAISVALLVVMGLAFGWAVGRMVRGRRGHDDRR